MSRPIGDRERRRIEKWGRVLQRDPDQPHSADIYEVYTIHDHLISSCEICGRDKNHELHVGGSCHIIHFSTIFESKQAYERKGHLDQVYEETQGLLAGLSKIKKKRKRRW